MRLSEIIIKLNNIPGDLPISFDIGNKKPGKFISWRGDYTCLSWWPINPELLGDKGETVADALHQAKSAVGKEFDGYNGGTSLMTINTPVFADRYGKFSGNAIVDIVVKPRHIIGGVTQPSCIIVTKNIIEYL